MTEILVWIAIFLTTVILHELCHGLAAYALGDPTAKENGRLTLNPIKHLDIWWTILLPALLFFSTHGRFAIGMAKPVPVNFNRLRHPKRDMIWVALAGPLANIVLATVLAFAWRFFGSPSIDADTPANYFLYGVYFNLGLAMFNLIPIPPLDGSKILAGMLPLSVAVRFLQIEPVGYIIILALYFTHLLFYAMIPGIDLFCRFLNVPRLGVNF